MTEKYNKLPKCWTFFFQTVDGGEKYKFGVFFKLAFFLHGISAIPIKEGKEAIDCMQERMDLF